MDNIQDAARKIAEAEGQVRQARQDTDKAIEKHDKCSPEEAHRRGNEYRKVSGLSNED